MANIYIRGGTRKDQAKGKARRPKIGQNAIDTLILKSINDILAKQNLKEDDGLAQSLKRTTISPPDRNATNYPVIITYKLYTYTNPNPNPTHSRQSHYHNPTNFMLYICIYYRRCNATHEGILTPQDISDWNTRPTRIIIPRNDFYTRKQRIYSIFKYFYPDGNIICCISPVCTRLLTLTSLNSCTFLYITCLLYTSDAADE